MQEVDGEGGFAKISFLARRAFKCLLCKSQTGPQQG